MQQTRRPQEAKSQFCKNQKSIKTRKRIIRTKKEKSKAGQLFLSIPFQNKGQKKEGWAFFMIMTSGYFRCFLSL